MEVFWLLSCLRGPVDDGSEVHLWALCGSIVEGGETNGVNEGTVAAGIDLWQVGQRSLQKVLRFLLHHQTFGII